MERTTWSFTGALIASTLAVGLTVLGLRAGWNEWVAVVVGWSVAGLVLAADHWRVSR